MKGLIKLFSAVAFVGTLASCSDDLSLSKSEGFFAGGDLYATLNTGDEATRMGVLEDKTVVWSLGDKIKVYSPDALKFNTYNLLPASAGYSSGTFERVGDDNLGKSSGLVAITATDEKQKDTKVYADEEGIMNLIAKIPAQFDQFEKTQAGGSILYWPLKVPYYGLNVSFNADNSLNATMNPLAALLKIDVKALPEGTKAIVLTTHFDSWIDGTMKDADLRMLRTETNMIQRIQDAETAGYLPPLGGKDEALSGTLNAKLVPGTKLVVNEDYKHADTLRVNIDELESDQDKIIFVPIVAQRYERLTVLAVSDDSKEPYFWPNAEVLKVFEDQEIKVNGLYTMAEAAPVEFPGTTGLAPTAENLAKYVAELTANDGAHNINVLVTVPLTGDYLYIANNIPGKSNVNITFKNANTAPFDIVEAFANYNPEMTGWLTLSTSKPWMDIPAPADYNTIVSQKKQRYVTLNFAENEVGHNIILPTSNVVIEAEGKGFKGNVAIVASTFKQVSGYTDENDWDTPYNLTNAAITLKGGIQEGYMYEILGGQKGDIFLKGDGIEDEIRKIQIDGTLTNPANFNMRITDMLVWTIFYKALGANAETVIYTTGNAAIHEIKEGHTGHNNTAKVNASWTGKQLSKYACVNKYDQEQIFTAAQLQGMGRAFHEGWGPAINYYEMNDRVRSVWLGASLFPWIGADVSNPSGKKRADSFEFYGKKTNFRNMVLDLYEPWIPVDCCCADNRVRVDANLGLISRVLTEGTVYIHNIDLTDAIINTEDLVIPNIGSICGLIEANGSVGLYNTRSSAIRIDARGTNIGGAYGLVSSASDVDASGLKVFEGSSQRGTSWVESEDKNVGGIIGAIYYKNGTAIDYVPVVTADQFYVKNQYTRSKDDNVGGQVGLIKAAQLNYGGDGLAVFTGSYKVPNALESGMYTEANVEVYSDGGSNVGGLIGQADYKTYANTKIRGTVYVQDRIQADINEKKTNSLGVNESGSNVGGLVGLNIIASALSAKETTEIEGEVSTKYLIAENRNAGGFVGYYEADEINTLAVANANKVTISKLLEATEGYVGGLYGYIRTAYSGQIGTDLEKKKHINVTIGEIKGAKAVGGLIGATTEGSTSGGSIYVVSSANDNINIDIDKWTISKSPFFFRTVSDRKMNGSFGTVVGWLNGMIDITDDGLTVYAADPEKGTFVEFDDDGKISFVEKEYVTMKKFKRDDAVYGLADFESKNPIFTELKKLNLLFWMQKVSQATIDDQKITGQGLLYWGDENGYVGVNNNSADGGFSYVLNGVGLQGDVNYNLYYDWNTNIWEGESDYQVKNND